MTDELARPKSHEERIASCPIHELVDIDKFLLRAQVPEHLWKPFHEIVLSRGEFPMSMNPEQGDLFKEQAIEITQTHEMDLVESGTTNVLLGLIIKRWTSIEEKQ